MRLHTSRSIALSPRINRYELQHALNKAHIQAQVHDTNTGKATMDQTAEYRCCLLFIFDIFIIIDSVVISLFILSVLMCGNDSYDFS